MLYNISPFSDEIGSLKQKECQFHEAEVGCNLSGYFNL